MISKSILKWAGNKAKLAPTIVGIFGDKHKTLVEPFVGSAGVFLNSNFERYILSDANSHLIGMYHRIIVNPSGVIDRMEELYRGSNNQIAYNSIRELFNMITDSDEKAAMFAFLNRHSFNGLVRYNRDGLFNAPFGRYDRPYFPKDEVMSFYDKAMSVNVRITCQDYMDALIDVPDDSAVYLDPPYVPTSKSNLQSWMTPFTMEDQINLVLMAQALTKRGCTVVISNHDLPSTRKLYAEANDIIAVDVRRSISCKGDGRGKVGELLAVYSPEEAR